MCQSPGLLFYLCLVITTLSQISTSVYSMPLESSDLDDAILYSNLEDALDQAILSNMASDPASDSASFEDVQPYGSSHTPTDTPSLLDLMRSAMHTELKRLEGRKSFRFPGGGQLLKRSFDSISRSSGFGGMHRGSWGGMNRGGENLTFTFESLFPAIARGLRSVK